MIFERLWVCFCFRCLWPGWSGNGGVRCAVAPLLLKTAMTVAVILALAEPVFESRDRKVALAALVDTSASITRCRSGARKLAAAANGKRPRLESPGRHSVRPSSPRADRRKKRDPACRAPPERTGAAPISNRPSARLWPRCRRGTIHRLVLLTDGNENEGAATRAAWQAQQLGVPIDTIALAGRTQPQLQTQAVGVPGAVFTGEHFPGRSDHLFPARHPGHRRTGGGRQGHRHPSGHARGGRKPRPHPHQPERRRSHRSERQSAGAGHGRIAL